jgi:hypothetical protein
LELWAGGAETSTAQVEKSFLLLFSKKEALPSLPNRPQLPPCPFPFIKAA